MHTQLINRFTDSYFAVQPLTGNLVRDRVETITGLVVSRLIASGADAAEVLSRPDVQECIRVMQTGFASTGDQENVQLMVDVLIDYSQQPHKTILKSIASDTLATLPKLTWQQLDILSLLFLLKHTRRADNCHPERLHRYVTDYLIPFSASIPMEHSYYQHLEYLGCGTIGPTSVTLERILLDSYPAVFQYVGFSQDELDKVLAGQAIDPGLLAPSLYHDTQQDKYFKLNAIDDEMATQLLAETKLEQGLASELFKLHQSRPIECREEDVRKILPGIHPELTYLSTRWSESPLHITRLSVKGIYIAHANIRKQLRREL